MACACKVESFATAVRAREVPLDVVIPHSKVSQTVDILERLCQTEQYSDAAHISFSGSNQVSHFH